MPLELQAAKSRLLHTESAAGATGLQALTQRLQEHSLPSVMLQLRSLNPYVASAIQVSILGLNPISDVLMQPDMQ